ncbi:MAG: TonB-dependent receptor plug domain-containing protein [Lentimicrobiaceae bacterium]|nr:TonB-dependent receptor plug domain-containing protein [Lentimicrobiaceae bacterium]
MFWRISKYLVFVVFAALGTGKVSAQDTLQTMQLEEVTVREKSEMQSLPSKQMLDLEFVPNKSVQVSEALKNFSGISIKDYGGAGGLKTISVRGLGANHTAVSYDGVNIADFQSGQVDLGKFSLDNISFVSLLVGLGSQDDIFKPARLFASANLLEMQSKTPVFAKESKCNVKASLSGGSFGYIQPFLRLENKLGKRFVTAFQADFLYAKGNYPYTLYYGGASDSTSKERRHNSDIKQFRTEGDFFYNINKNNQIRLKGYYYNSERGLPGAVIFYNLHSTKRLWDENAFVQGSYALNINPKWRYLLNLKLNYAFSRYLDPEFLNSDRKLENFYYQREYYLSNAFAFKPLDSLLFTIANDVFTENMSANTYNFPFPVRRHVLTNIAGSYSRKYFNVKIALLHSFVADKKQLNDSSQQLNRFTPTVHLEFYPMKYKALIFNLLYQNTFRLPTFNELYYNSLNNRVLNPEKVRQYAFSALWTKYVNRRLPYFSLHTNLYFNQIEDKIVAIPTQNLFVWTIVNYGKVDIIGTDITLKTNVLLHAKISLEIMGSYSLQHAVNKTDANSKTYLHQIPYTPKNAGVGQCLLKTRWIDVSYSIFLTGKRYTMGENIPANELSGYAEQNISLGRDFTIKKIRLHLGAEMLNLTNKNYEVIRNFPMQGRSFRVQVRIGKNEIFSLF